MCEFYIQYLDGEKLNYEHIISASYLRHDKTRVDVPENDLSNHRFDAHWKLWLHSESGTVTVNADGIRAIEVTEEFTEE